MTDVFLLGVWVAYSLLAATISVTVEVGALCFILVGLLTLFTRAIPRKSEIWETILPQASIGSLVEPAIGYRVMRHYSACRVAEHLVPAVQCHADPPTAPRGRHRRCTDRRSLSALLPRQPLPNGDPADQPGALAIHHLWGLGLLVFSASFVTPFLKLTGLTYCIVSALHGSRRRLVLEARLYNVVEEIGRWSMVDPFVIACSLPAMQYNGLIYGEADGAAAAFTAIVILTMLATQSFDPRLMWDAAAILPRRRPTLLGARA